MTHKASDSYTLLDVQSLACVADSIQEEAVVSRTQISAQHLWDSVHHRPGNVQSLGRQIYSHYANSTEPVQKTSHVAPVLSQLVATFPARCGA